jgi:hypothetical protein
VERLATGWLEFGFNCFGTGFDLKPACSGVLGKFELPSFSM